MSNDLPIPLYSGDFIMDTANAGVSVVAMSGNGKATPSTEI